MAEVTSAPTGIGSSIPAAGSLRSGSFLTEDECLEYLVSLRWPGGVQCPRCGNPKVYRLHRRPWHWQCKKCEKHGYRFSALVGTVFENTNYPLRSWFRVVRALCQSEQGLNALQLHRLMGDGSYRTAWYMCRRIRIAVNNATLKARHQANALTLTAYAALIGNWLLDAMA
jgi:transposase-like protein